MPAGQFVDSTVPARSTSFWGAYRLRPPPLSSVTALPFDGRLLRGWGNVVGGVFREKAVRLEHEPDVGGRHHRIVLRPREVGVAEGGPQHPIRVDEGAGLFGPARRAVAPRGLVGA